MAGIIYGIEERKGFVAITGAVGVGKTTILRSYLEQADRKHLKIIYIFNARLTFEGLVKTIYQELGLQAESNDVLEMVNRLYEVLIDEYKQGNAVVMVIDEAQNMPVDTLEDLRMLSNLETSKDKLIQIVLVGQPEFEDELNLDRLKQLKQRLAVRAKILPLTEAQSVDYVKFRLQKAGADREPIFTDAAVKKIVKNGKGIPRVMNVICDNSLITGLGYQKKPVTAKIVEEIISDLEGSKPKRLVRWWVFGSVVLALILAGIAWLLPRGEVAAGKTKGVSQYEHKDQDAAAKDISPDTKPTVEKGEAERISVAAQAREEVRVPAEKSELPVVKKTVVLGDTLTKLSLDVYGYTDTDVVKWVQQNNPQITDPDVIPVGITVTFPSVPSVRARAR